MAGVPPTHQLKPREFLGLNGLQGNTMTAPQSKPRPLVAGNWKMNGLKNGLAEALAVRDALAGPLGALAADAMIAPPASLLMVMAEACRGGKLQFAGQDCHASRKRRPYRRRRR